MKEKIKKSNVAEIFSLTELQEGMLYHFLKEREENLYNVQLSLRLEGELDVPILKAAFHLVQQGNEALRSVFRWEEVSKPVQIVLRECPAEIVFRDLSMLPAADAAEAVKDYAGRDWTQRFDLEQLPLRLTVLKETERVFFLQLTFHHILFDGWSNGILFTELFSYYRQLKEGGIPPLVEKPRYKTVVLDARRNMDEEAKRRFWRTYLSGYTAKGHFGKRTLTPADASEAVRFRVVTDIDTLDGFAREHRVTKAAVIYTAYGLLLQKYCGDGDIVFGTTVSSRDAAIHGVDRVMGSFINLIPMRLTSSPAMPLIELIRLVNADMVKRNPFHGTSLPEIRRLLDMQAGEQLFDSVLGIENYPLDDQLSSGVAGLDIRLHAVQENTNSPLVVLAYFSECLELEFNYKTGVLSEAFIRVFSSYMVAIIREILQHPEQLAGKLPVPGNREKERLLYAFNDTAADFPAGKTMGGLFEEQAARTPEKTALVGRGERVTYGELNERVLRLTHFLQGEKAVRGEVIGICMYPSPAMITAMLAIWKCGCAYLPISPDLPPARIAGICEEAGVRRILTEDIHLAIGADLEQLDMAVIDWHRWSPDGAAAAGSSGDLAYVIYTSGTTGTPKGVMISHRNLVNYFCWLKDFLDLGPADKTALVTSFAFDLGYTALYSSLIAGGELHLLPKADYATPEIFLSYVEAQGITYLKLTPSFFATFADHPALTKMGKMRLLIFGGEEFPVQSAEKIFQVLPQVALVNHYGPTETTIGVVARYITRAELPELRRDPAIGRPIRNARCYILNGDGEPVGIGMKGELYIGGAGVGPGYLNQPQLTGERFPADPFVPGGKLYRTGDQARWLPDGNIEFLGRMDRQVKIRGYRVEPKEVEQLLRQFEAVTGALVVPKTNGPETVLVAYYLSAAEKSDADLRSFLAGRLPEYMVPVFFSHLTAWPLNENGKFDRKALPEPDFSDKHRYIPPGGAIEEKLVAIWAQVLSLNKEKISVTASFLELGGHSLSIILMLNRVYKEFNVLVTINDIFTLRHIRAIGKFIAEKTRAGFAPIAKAPAKDVYRLSSAQKRLYFLHSFDASSTAYNGIYVIRCTGPLDIDRTADIFRQLIRRHESLRTSFHTVDGEPVQRIADEAAFSLELFQTGEEAIQETIARFVRPFDVTQPCLMRAGVIQLAPDSNILLVDTHHIIGDGVSQELLIRDFMALYEGRILKEPKLQYKDFSEWRSSPEQQKAIANQRDFWLGEFPAMPEALDLPADHPRPLVNDHAGAMLQLALSPEDFQRAKRMAEKEGVTLFMLLLAVYNILLSKLSNQEDITIGTAVSGRDHPDTEGIVGMFVNTLPLRNYPTGSATFREFLAEVKKRMLAGIANQSYPFELLIDELKLERNTSRNPLFDVMFTYQSFKETELRLPGLTLAEYPHGHTVAKFDLTLIAFEKDNGLRMSFEYSTRLFEEARVRKMAGYFRRILTAVLENGDSRLAELDVLSVTERSQLLFGYNETRVDLPVGVTIVSLFDGRVEADPDAVALVIGSEKVSYRQLQQKADVLAGAIHSVAAPGESIRVGILATNPVEIAAGILAVLRGGHVFVPLAAEHPVDRNRYILEDCGAGVLLTGSGISNDVPVPEGCRRLSMGEVFSAASAAPATSVARPAASLSAEDVVSIIYTSGTTGQPKGVAVRHAGILNYTLWRISWHKLTPEDRTLQLVPYYFDGFGSNFYSTLLSGGAVVFIEVEKKLDVYHIAGVIRAERVTNFALLPRLYAELLTAMSPMAEAIRLRFVVLAGEAAGARLLAESRTVFPLVSVENEYGPTEATIAATHNGAWKEDAPFVTGKPIWNTSLYILGKYQELLPPGVRGEVCISGMGLAAGYINNDALTADRFIAHPYIPGEKLYRTGDIGSWNQHGELEIRGRLDNQVKIRGFRVEPRGIATVLCTHEEVRDAVVEAVDRGEGKQLVAYYAAEKEVTVAALDSFLSGLVPGYMIPSRYIFMSRLPYTAVGKLDRSRLPEVDAEWTAEYVAPRTAEERLLAEVWSKTLGVERIGITDNFFAIGGDSIRSIQICSRMRAAGYELTVKDIFAGQTIQALAPKLKTKAVASAPMDISGKAPLSPIQRWLMASGVKFKKHFNQAVMLEFAGGIEEPAVRQLFGRLLRHHDALRMVFPEDAEEMVQPAVDEGAPLSLEVVDLRQTDEIRPEEDLRRVIRDHANRLQAGLDPARGLLMRLGLFRLNSGSRLLIVIHHLVIDGVSWRILLEDIDELYRASLAGKTCVLSHKSDPFLSWPGRIQSYMRTRGFQEASSYWDKAGVGVPAYVPRAFAEEGAVAGESRRETFVLDSGSTIKLLTTVHAPFRTRVDEVLLTALLLACRRQYGVGQLSVDLESHGRAGFDLGEDFSRTVGWFTSIYPVLLEADGDHWGAALKAVKEKVRGVPNQGVDWLIKRYCSTENSPGGQRGYDRQRDVAGPRISFNYLGNFDADVKGRAFTVSLEDTGDNRPSEDVPLYDWEISGIVVEGRLVVSLSHRTGQYGSTAIRTFLDVYREVLDGLIEYCCGCTNEELTLSDLSCRILTASQLEALQNSFSIEDIYPLSPMQEMLLFHSRLDPVSENYFEQMAVAIKGPLQPDRVETAMNALVARHGLLRTLFPADDFGRPLQAVLRRGSVAFVYRDHRAECRQQGKEAVIDACCREQRATKFDLAADSLIRLWMVRTGEEEYELIWAHHHIIMDGWCMGIILRDFREFYTGTGLREAPLLPPVTPYSAYISWLEGRDKAADRDYWKNYLRGYDSLATLPRKDAASALSLSYEPAIHRQVIDAEFTDALEGFARRLGATVNTILQAAWGILLSRYNQKEDVVFGAVVSGRTGAVAGIESMVGLFINTIPVRIGCGEALTVRRLLAEVQENFLASEQYGYLTLAEIQSVSLAGRGLLDHLMVVENYPIDLRGEQLAGDPDFVITGVKAFEQNNYHFWLAVVPGETITIKYNYNKSVFDEELVVRVAVQFGHILRQMIADSDRRIADIELLTERDRRLLLQSYNDTEGAYPADKTIVTLFEEQVAATPNRVAVVCRDRALTYAALNDRVNRLAGYLRQRGVKPGDTVAILCERSVEMMIGLLGILKSGAAYVPIDPSYPRERIDYILDDCRAGVLVTDGSTGSGSGYAGEVVLLSQALEAIGECPVNPAPVNTPEDLCYVIYTSGSTGRPKGVMISHGNVVNFFEGMNRHFQLEETDSILAVTSISFDISVLELFWTLCQGVQVVIHPADGQLADLDNYIDMERVDMELSLFFFSSYNNREQDKYGLLLDSVRYADQHGFDAVWIPERHFHEFGGLYPNPSVIAAALAMCTKRIALRSGSVVAPLHDPIRIAEEWAVVDNLSGGRVGLSFASGWNPNDFVLSRADYQQRQKCMYGHIDTVRHLWRGGSVRRENALGQPVELRVFPAPIQKELPVWVTAAKSEETFASAGETGANVLTHLLGQDLDQLKKKIARYRKERAAHGFDKGKVAVMLHTYIGDTLEEVERLVEKPFVDYLRSSIGLGKVLFEEAGVKEEDMPEAELQIFLRNAFKRYYKTSSLIGTIDGCIRMVRRLKAIGVDEIACLVDFGLEKAMVMEGLERLNKMKERMTGAAGERRLHRPVTLLQSTPSFIKLLEADDSGSSEFLASLRLLLVGGEAAPAALINRIRRKYKADVYNMYGPTETTIWSSVHPFETHVDRVSVGKPILNTRIYVLDHLRRLLPPGIAGDLYIGGKGLSRGYWNRPALTAERFIDNPLVPGESIYHTGDIAKWLPDGNLLILGRGDNQVKIRGHRIEPGEIENVLTTYGPIKEAVVAEIREREGEGSVLAAYVVGQGPLESAGIRHFLQAQLPEYMIPVFFIPLDSFPLTPNGKIDRKALPDPYETGGAGDKMATGPTEERLVEIWSEILGIGKDKIGVSRSFFELGGHSLNATVLVNRIYKEFDVRIKLQKIFLLNSIELIAEHIENSRWIQEEAVASGEPAIVL